MDCLIEDVGLLTVGLVALFRLRGPPGPPGSEALPSGSEALPPGSEALPAGSEAFPAGSDPLPAGDWKSRRSPCLKDFPRVSGRLGKSFFRGLCHLLFGSGEDLLFMSQFYSAQAFWRKSQLVMAHVTCDNAFQRNSILS